MLAFLLDDERAKLGQAILGNVAAITSHYIAVAQVPGEGFRVWVSWSVTVFVGLATATSLLVSAWKKTGWWGLDKVRKWMRL